MSHSSHFWSKSNPNSRQNSSDDITLANTDSHSSKKKMPHSHFDNLQRPSEEEATTEDTGLPPPERPRAYQKPTDHDAELAEEEIEREFAHFGGDVPADEVRVKKTRTRRGTMRSTRSASTFPDLHLIDSAYSDAHRALSRAYSTVISENGQPIQIEERPVDPNKVDWLPNDPDNPQNWSYRRKWAITMLTSLLTVNVTFASSAPSAATAPIAAEFGSSTEVAILTTSLFLAGYVLGPIIWAPLSELFGRRYVFVGSMFVYLMFQLTATLGKNITTIVVGRFLAGTFAAAPLTNSGGVIADIWDPVGRGVAMTVFSAGVFIGPVAGPIIAGFIVDSSLGWRWVFWVLAIFSLACWIMVCVFLPETYAPVLLAQKAKKMRKDDPVKNKDVYAELEKADFSLKSIITRTLARPFRMLAIEPLLLFVTIYLSAIYGVLYGLFSVIPIIFEQNRGFSASQSGLIFLGIGIGVVFASITNLYLQRHYKWLVPRWHGTPPPEQRLKGAMVGAPLLVIGALWLGWTGNYASIPWYVPALSTPLIGCSITLLFISFLSYLIEVYLMYSASALAANTVCRSAVGAAFPLFVSQMFARLGINWALTLIGGIALLLAPLPFLFYYYGAIIRDGSFFAPCIDLRIKEQVEQEVRDALEKEKGMTV